MVGGWWFVVGKSRDVLLTNLPTTNHLATGNFQEKHRIEWTNP
jgi:hypothetical protein